MVKQINFHTQKNGNHVPSSIMQISRKEVDLHLMIAEGEIPSDICGHVFVIAPVGFHDDILSEELLIASKAKTGDSLLNGDGMIYRLDFNIKNEAYLKTRLIRTPDYYADIALQSNPNFDKLKSFLYRFRSQGISRFSIRLGLRSQLNTAFLAMKFENNDADRMLVTYDTSRPYEVNPETLKIITPVGGNREWKGELDSISLFKKQPFKSILSTAHLAFDYSGQGEMFTVNYGRSLVNLMSTIPFVDSLIKMPLSLRFVLTTSLFLGFGIVYRFSSSIVFQLTLLMIILIAIYGVNIKLFLSADKKLDDFVHLLSWDGINKLKRWQLLIQEQSEVLKPVAISQTIHQIGVTRDYVVLMDTAFVAGVTQLTNQLPAWLRGIFGKTASPESIVYIVQRADLKDDCTRVVAKRVSIPLEAAHFLVDYENPYQTITLHISHLCGMQVAEWIRNKEISGATKNMTPGYLMGMQHNITDIGRLGRYEINAETGIIMSSKVITDNNCTWAADLYTYLERHDDGTPIEKITNIYWGSFGLWSDLMTRYICKSYQKYKYRLLALEDVIELAKEGQPCSLFNLETESMVIKDYYLFPCDHMMLSPQFIPRGNRSDPTNGYITCVVFIGEISQIWIFDASSISSGPLCKLEHPDMKIGFTLHTTWLKEIQKSESGYCVDIREDYDYMVSQNKQDIQDFFEDHVYKYF
ncbi:MAG: carotenoid oxygenase family protein [Cyanobacteria bacterium P01_G01_bin.54]